MSDAIALVRFPNGELRAAYYFGSADMVVPPLYALDDAEDLLMGGMEAVLARLEDVGEPETEPHDAEDVEIWSSYGAGAHWPGRASRSLGMILEGVDPYGTGADLGGSAEPPRPVSDGTPDWVPTTFRD